jgi:hypothetical protein
VRARTRDFAIDGRPVADVLMEDRRPFGGTQVGGRVLLFRDQTRWTLLTIRFIATKGHGFGHVAAVTYPGLTHLRAGHESAAYWRSLLEAGAEHDADLRELWRTTGA